MNNLPNKQEFSIINPKIESWHEFVLQVHQVTEWDASVVGEWPYRPDLSRGPWCQSRELLRSIEPAGKLNITFEISSPIYLNPFFFVSKDKYVEHSFETLPGSVSPLWTRPVHWKRVVSQRELFGVLGRKGRIVRCLDRRRTYKLQVGTHFQCFCFCTLCTAWGCQKRITSSVSPDLLLHFLAPGS